jgi:hypothetical protein
MTAHADVNRFWPADQNATPWVATPDGSQTRAAGVGVNPDIPRPQKEGLRWPITLCRSGSHADAAGTGVLDTAFPDADPGGSSPIRKHFAAPGDCVPNFQPWLPRLLYLEGIQLQ